ncbi:alkene reductase [Agrobacterium tumefaciens]|uniref:alkene reductase n=1 Tax=Agrobacterium tumefaciens TaxID=358 RepID=UPI003BA35529
MPAPETLLSPIQLGPYTLRNRTAMAPLTRSRAGDGDVPTSLAVDYYRQRATAGLIVTEGSQISPQGKGYPRTPGIFSDAQVAGWEQVTTAVHAEGGRIFLQLWHVGRLSHSTMQQNAGLPVSSSAIAPEGEIYTATGLQPYETPRALDLEEIPGIVDDFRRAAENAKRAGFDGVELHGANGYLIDQFLRDGANHRTDVYGGSVDNRVRFLKEIVEAVILVFGAARIGVRLSPALPIFSVSDSDPAVTFRHAAETLSRYGLGYLHVVQLGDPAFDYTAIKRAFGGVYIANGGFDADSAEAAVTSGAADLVAFGTKFLANPDLIKRFSTGAPLNQPDPATFYQGEERGYTDYPTLTA